MANNNYTTSETVAVESALSGVSWPAIIAGAFAAAAVSLSLLVLMSGFGLAVASPFSASDTETIASVTAKTLIALVVMQWLSSALGGYIAGRLRTRWSTVNGDEVFFRDTAHGFLTWAVATILTAAFLASAGAAVVKGAGHVAGTAAVASAASDENVDALFRSDRVSTTTDATRNEVGRIVARSIADGRMTESDSDYLARVVARETGISASEAEARIDTTIEQAKDKAEKARKAAATFSIITFLSMLIGAFVASVAAALGGRQRDLI